MTAVSILALRLAIGVNLLLPVVHIMLFLLYGGIPEWCTFDFCYELDDLLLVGLFINMQLMALAVAWLAHLLKRNGMEWLGWAAAFWLAMINIMVLTKDNANEIYFLSAVAAFILVPSTQFIWLLKRGWRDLVAIKSATHGH